MDASVFSFVTMAAIGLTSFYYGYGVGFIGAFLIGQILGVLYQKFVIGRHHVPRNAAILITGCSSGIGLEGAICLAKKGFVIIAGVRKLEDANLLIEQTRGCTIKPVVMDVAQPDQIEDAKREVESYLQQENLHLLAVYNNAGYPETSVLELIDLNHLRRQLEVNVVGQVAVSQAFLPLLRQCKIPNHSPRLIFVSSGVGWMTVPAMGAYCASKHALEAVGDAFRMELQSWGIDVVIIEPGSIRSKFNKVSRETLQGNLNMTSNPVKERYQKMCDVMLKKQLIMGKINFSTDVTDAAFKAAVLDKIPLTRYRAGADSVFGMPIVIHLPDRLADFIFAQFFRKA